MIPQLRCRTEFSFRDGSRDIATFAPLSRMADALAAIEAPAAGIVDGGTWGHVKWAKALDKRGVAPLFGVELAIPSDDGRKPRAWALAAETGPFYRFSTAARQEGADIAALFASSPGLVRFAGAALDDPDCFDYVDINPGSGFAQRRGIELARHTGRPLVLTSDTAYATPADFASFMAISGRTKVTPQHLLPVDEMRRAFPLLDDDAFDLALLHTCEAAERCATKLQAAPMIHFDGDLVAAVEAGAARRVKLGHIAAWTDDYEARLKRELRAIADKGFESYFLIVADLIAWAKTQMLVGPGRGSSAGSLVCYCLGITEVDPMPFGLLFERFIDVTRSDLPDIDIDFSQQHKCFEYLAEKYGSANVARLGNVNTFQPRTVMGKASEAFGIPKEEVFGLLNALPEYKKGDARFGHSIEDALKSDTGRQFLSLHPYAEVMGDLEGHASHTGVHAAGVIVSNVRLDDFCTIKDGIAQIDKPDAEALNLLKIDALGLSTLAVIEDAGVVTGDELYALKLDDPKVFEVFNEHRFGSVFQFEGQAQRGVSRRIKIESFQQIDHITALARPGPMGSGATERYIARAAGREPVTFMHPSMEAYLAETLGLVLYQEQVMRIAAELGGFSWPVVSELRKAMSGSKGREYFDRRGAEFMEGATARGVPKEQAAAIWAELVAFGGWGMNKSHTCAYSVVAYWCAWMKAYHPLEYAAAGLRQAGTKTDGEAKVLELLRELMDEGVDYIAFDPELSQEDWSVQDGKLVGGFRNLVGFGPSKSAAAVRARAAGTMTDKMRAAIAKAPRKYLHLFPIAAEFRDIFIDPEGAGCAPGSEILSSADIMSGAHDGRMVLFIGKVVKKQQRDENEPAKVAKRGGEVKTGQTLYADIHVRDDLGAPIIARIPSYRRRNRETREFESASFEPLGRAALERLETGKDVVLIRGKKIPGFAMLQVLRMKCLTRPEVFGA
jgi:DNA polymerase III alpha subunit